MTLAPTLFATVCTGCIGTGLASALAPGGDLVSRVCDGLITVAYAAVLAVFLAGALPDVGAVP